MEQGKTKSFDIFLSTILCWLPWLAGIAFFAAIVTSLLTPIYPDEYGYQLNYARAVFDNYTSSSYFPPCASSLNVSIPLFWYPARTFYWLIYALVENARALRFIGVSIYLCVLLCIATLIWKALEERVSKGKVFATISAFLTLGVMPSVFSFNRPEIILAGCIAWFTFAPFITRNTSGKLVVPLLFIIHTLVASFFFSSHGKSILFAPLFLVSTFFITNRLFRGKLIPSFITFLFIFPILSSYSAFKVFSSCAESRAVASINSSQYFIPDREMLKSPATVFSVVRHNLAEAIPSLKQNLFELSYPIGWLPGFNQTWLEKTVNFSAMGTYYLILMAAIAVIGWSIISFFQTRTMKMASIIFWALSQGIFALFCVQSAKHFYESALTLPCFAIAAGLIAKMILDRDTTDRLIYKVFFILLMGVSTISSCLYSSRIFPKYKRGFSGPSISITKYNHAAIKAEMKKAGDVCAVKNDSTTSHLVVDDLSYMFFKKSFQPYNAAYLAWSITEMRGADIVNSDAFFKEMKAVKASGIVQRCTYMNMVPAWGRNSEKIGDICCISKATIDRLGSKFE